MDYCILPPDFGIFFRHLISERILFRRQIGALKSNCVRPFFRNSEIVTSLLPRFHEQSLMFYRFLKEREKRARVHFIPNLKVGVFVTLCAPEVITILASATVIHNPSCNQLDILYTPRTLPIISFCGTFENILQKISEPSPSS